MLVLYIIYSNFLFKYITTIPIFINFIYGCFWQLFTLALTKRKNSTFFLLSVDCHHSSIFTFIKMLCISDGRGNKGWASAKIMMPFLPHVGNVCHFSLVFPFCYCLMYITCVSPLVPQVLNQQNLRNTALNDHNQSYWAACK